MTVAYVDASALSKLVLREPESSAFATALEPVDTVLTSAVGQVEFERAVRRANIDDPERAIRDVLDRVECIPLHAAVVGLAGAVGPPRLRTLDAIHLATMLGVRDDLDVAFVYDERLAQAATALGITVQAPR